MTSQNSPSGRILTPSRTPALAGIFTIFLLLGFAGLIIPIRQAITDYRTAKVYVESTAEILEYLPISRRNYWRSGRHEKATVRPSFVFRFLTIDGEKVTTRGYDSYGGREAPMSEAMEFKVGSTYPAWYDPANPKKAVLSKRFNPHYYWILLLPLFFIGFNGLLLRECLRRASPPVLKGVETGRRLTWRLPPAATHRGMTGCLGFFLVILTLLTTGFVFAALDYQDVVPRYRLLSRVLGFNVNGWWFVAIITAVVTLVFLWAFLVNLRWIVLPEPEVEVDETRLLPGRSTRLSVLQRGPIRAESYAISLICEINGIPGKPPARKEIILERSNLHIESQRPGDAIEFTAPLTIPKDGKLSTKVVSLKGGKQGQRGGGELVAWFIRVERKVTAKNVLQSDFEILVGPETY